MRAALKGAPLKGIYFQSDKVTFYLVADPSIKTAADLKGKKVAIGSAGDTQDRMITMFAERGGVTSKEIMRIAVGADTSTRILTIKSGNAQATTVDPGGLVFAQKKVSCLLGFLGDLFPMPFQGFVATEKKSATIRRRSSAGSRARCAVLCSCAIGPRKPSISV